MLAKDRLDDEELCPLKHLGHLHDVDQQMLGEHAPVPVLVTPEAMRDPQGPRYWLVIVMDRLDDEKLRLLKHVDCSLDFDLQVIPEHVLVLYLVTVAVSDDSSDSCYWLGIVKGRLDDGKLCLLKHRDGFLIYGVLLVREDVPV